MTVLITGGLGYIGSHVAHLVAKVHQGEKLVVVDNLSTGSKNFIAPGAIQEIGDVREGQGKFVEDLLKKHQVDSIIHLAASIKVDESVRDPGKYYSNNFVATQMLVDAALRAGVKHFVFSSTAAVYGNPSLSPVEEDAPLKPESPYGHSKLMCEQLLSDTARAHPSFRCVALRYFNVGGADLAGRCGYKIEPNPSHLLRKALAVAAGYEEVLSIFGTDYPTPDGTAIRDYIHVQDVALAHTYALSHLANAGESGVYNVGYGRGYSVLDIVHAVERVTGKTLPIEFKPRRPGDSTSVVADSSKIRREFGWVPDFEALEGLEKMVHSQYRFEHGARRA